jgi:DNA repair exonuclease SbcCD nuclease subunit
VYAPCHVDDLVRHGYDYWALGHIHQHAVVRAGAPWVVYAGSPQGRHVGEAGDHGAYVLQVQDGALVGEPEHVELATVRWHRETIVAGSDEDDAADLVVQATRRLADLAAAHPPEVLHVVRLTLEGRCAAHAQLSAEPGRWRDELQLAAASIGAAEVCLERVRVRTQPVLPDPEVLRERSDFVGDLARHLAAEQLARAEGDGREQDDGGGGARIAALTRLDDKLRVLAAAGDALRDQPVASGELDAASDELLSRLLVAQHEELEANR